MVFISSAFSGISVARSFFSCQSFWILKSMKFVRVSSPTIFQSPIRMATRSLAGETWVRQKRGIGRSRGLSSNTGSMLTPSMTRSFGASSPVISRMVEKRSVPMTGVSLVVPALIWLGQRTIPGTRMPPSWSLRLRPRRPPVEPPLLRSGGPTFPSGPLSEVKKKKVFSVRPCSSSASITMPRAWSSWVMLPM